MKTDITDPWCGSNTPDNQESNNSFEDSFVEPQLGYTKFADSEEYLERLYTRLKNLQRGTSKKDLVASLSIAKEESIARFINSGCIAETQEEAELASNPLIRHIVPHLQALTASELVHLLKADVLQITTEARQEEQQKHETTDKILEEQETKNHRPKETEF